MRNIILSLIVALTVPAIFTGCSYFGNGAVRSTAEVISLKKLKAVLLKEVDATITKNHPRANDFVVFVMQNTKSEVESLIEVTDDQRQVKMKVSTISPEIRQMILEIVGKLEGKKANAFNFSDALGMIKLQKKDTNMFVIQNFTLNLHKTDFNWHE